MPSRAQLRQHRARSRRFPRGPGGRLRRRADSGPSTRMRGLRTPNIVRRSASTMRSTVSRRAGVSAALTLRKGRWVVASATRRPPPTSIITGSCAPVCRARYSVWPVNGMPASLIERLLHRRRDDRVEARRRRSRRARHRACRAHRGHWRGSSTPGSRRRGERHVQQFDAARAGAWRRRSPEDRAWRPSGAGAAEKRAVADQHQPGSRAARSRAARCRGRARCLPARRS